MNIYMVYTDAPANVDDVSEVVLKVGICLLAGTYVTKKDVKYIAETIKSAIVE